MIRIRVVIRRNEALRKGNVAPFRLYTKKAMLEAIRFLWNATRGSRLRPWRSPYLCWRYETYTGKPAKEVRLGDFLRLMGSERRQFLRFLGWVSEMKGYAGVAE